MRAVATLIFTLAISACSRNEIDPAFVGRFELETRDGRQLPAVLNFTEDGQQCTNEMFSSTLTVERNGDWTESYRVRRRCGPDGASLDELNERQEKGSSSHSGSNRSVLVFTSPEAESDGFDQSATVEGDELHMRSAVPASGIDLKFVYRRVAQ